MSTKTSPFAAVIEPSEEPLKAAAMRRDVKAGAKSESARAAPVSARSVPPGLGRTASAFTGFALAAAFGFGAVVGGDLLSAPLGEKIAGKLSVQASADDAGKVTQQSVVLSAVAADAPSADGRSAAVFSAAAPLLAVPVMRSVSAQLSPAGGTPGTSAVVRTVEAARSEPVVAPARRSKPTRAQPAAEPAAQIAVASSTAVDTRRGSLPMQPYGLGAGNLAKSADVAPKATTPKKIVCKSSQTLNARKTACIDKKS